MRGWSRLYSTCMKVDCALDSSSHMGPSTGALASRESDEIRTGFGETGRDGRLPVQKPILERQMTPEESVRGVSDFVACV
ncbi:hypothetical protein RUM44_006690 [Polyplax serrata]|uniref:Uncharacterized protein n=1 Tax=Polyplax serrata TaxID=468196 RepID=A0ABR1AIU2_POLSC